MPWPRLFDNPLFGDHSPLVLGWSDDQLWPIVGQLAELLPPGLPDGMQLAIASCARSIAAEKKLTGRPVHFPRGNEAYRIPHRYRRRGPRYSRHYITRSMDILETTGLIKQELGMWCPGNKGLQSIAWATDKLMNLLGPVIDVEERPALPARDETVVLRDREDKAPLDYEETSETARMRAQVGIVNDALSQLDLRLDERRVETPVGRRIFNGSFRRGGRFYCHGPSFQNMPAQQRRELELVIGGVAHPLVEIDYCNLHIAMAYQEAGKRMSPGDQYAIAGFDRGLVKVAVNTVMNARTIQCGILAVADELFHNRELRVASGIIRGSRRECRGLATKVVTAITPKHRRIEKYFGSDCGARFQRRDSDMAMQVMLRMIRRTGRCPLPLHDSFLVADIYAKPLADTMREVAHEYGLHPTLKVLRPGRPTTYPFHLKVTASDLVKQGGLVDRRKQAFSGGHTLKTFRYDDVFGCPSGGFICCHDPPRLYCKSVPGMGVNTCAVEPNQRGQDERKQR